jgi:hypothetical protein
MRANGSWAALLEPRESWLDLTMPDDSIPRALRNPQLIEELAGVEHERWAHWQRYLHAQCEPGPDGSLTIPPDLVRRWTEQMRTPYRELPDRDKDSDREQVHRYLPTIAAALEAEGRDQR